MMQQMMQMGRPMMVLCVVLLAVFIALIVVAVNQLARTH
jgi:hypothetical protein